eukprot:CAMPEP_0174860764 /NCGR_PEP_ID=MMETSP1114-20130205/49961_1 /TAXON_ID=312471 /ORGANISM="Neobodo designis, Strain CCAP 1951/1" /LENGTH=274 /DNA_ID=CAMNT_0016095749 /DNA_START=49 /DNA_END=869 /DNA_ORIENTATION=+
MHGDQPTGASPTADDFAAMWRRYWSEHRDLPAWHACTYRRRAAAASGLAEIDPEYEAPSAPCANAQLVVRASAVGGKRRADVELMFAAVARRAVVAAVSFAPAQDEATGDGDGDDDAAPGDAMTLRLQLCNEDTTTAVGRELASVVAVGADHGYAAVAPSRLILRGAGLGRLVRAVPPDELRGLFEVFGDCNVAYPDEESVCALERGDAAACPVISVAFTAAEPVSLADTDAGAALRSLQLWLAYDWGLFLTYDAGPPEPEEAAAVRDTAAASR